MYSQKTGDSLFLVNHLVLYCIVSVECAVLINGGAVTGLRDSHLHVLAATQTSKLQYAVQHIFNDTTYILLLNTFVTLGVPYTPHLGFATKLKI